MVIREVQDRDFVQLAEMRWTHAVEDDETYGEHNTDGVTNSFGNVCISYSDNSHPECKA